MAKFRPSKVNKSLRLIPLGGAGNVNRNMFAYECGDDIVILDCGAGFPDFEMLGVDITIPDISYLEKEGRKSKVRGIIITHAHYDHFGALPHILPHLPVPVYGSRLTLEFVRASLLDAGLPEKNDIFEIPQNGAPFRLGSFEITPFRVCHSVPDSLGLILRTPLGTVFHVSDYKFDWTPVDGKLFEVDKVVEAARREQPVLLVSDCLGATTPGYTQSEMGITASLEKELEGSAGQQVFVVTISSNISRIRQAITASQKCGRKVCFLGRSIEQSALIAEKLGYLRLSKKDLLDADKANGFDQKQVTYIAAGCYGQPDSAMSKIARDEHTPIKLRENAKVIFSADPSPPGARNSVDLVIDKLVVRGAQVSYYEIQENMHVSGHGSAGDIQMLFGLVRPKFLVPIGGTPKHMRAYALLASEMGYPASSVFELRESEFLEIAEGQPPHRGQFSYQSILVDGLRVGDIGEVVLRDRQVLASEGVVVLIVPIHPETGEIGGAIELVTRGFVYVKESQDLISDLERIVRKAVETNASKKEDWNKLKKQIENSVLSYVRQKTGRSPLVLPSIVEV